MCLKANGTISVCLKSYEINVDLLFSLLYVIVNWIYLCVLLFFGDLSNSFLTICRETNDEVL